MIIKAIKQLVETQTTLLQKKAGTFSDEVECAVDDDIVDCKEFKEPYTGVPAPVFLEEDPWFGPPPVLTEKQEVIRAQLEEEKQLIAKEEDKTPQKEVENIHEVMYNIATGNGKTTVQLDPPGGSENFQSGPGGWMSSTGLNQFGQGR